MEKWVIICNPEKYDILGVFDVFDRIDWTQSVDIKVGDIVYIYVSKPTGAIKYETKAVKVNKPNATIDDTEFILDGSNFENNERYMELRLLRRFDDEQLSYNIIMDNGMKTVRGPSRISRELDDFIINATSVIKTKDKRQYFFVFQNKSFNEEHKGGYLWAPQFAKTGNHVSHWDQMKNVQKGDLIIHSFKKKIVAISIAKTDVYEADRPVELPDQWETRGWRVDTEYYVIDDPIITSDHMKELIKLQPLIDSPFNRIGRGNMGYLFRANKEMAEFILKESALIQSSETEGRMLLDLMNKKEDDPIESQLDQELNEDLEILLSAYLSEIEPYNPEPKKKSKSQLISEKKVYPRSRKTAINALIRAKHKCEVDENHPSFIRKNTNLNYTEPHHLIPMAYQESYENSIDVEANIIALCSTCHNHIHFGEGADELVEILFKKRKEELEQAGIPISLEELRSLY